MELEFETWMRFYGKESSRYQLDKGDFLSEKYQDAISSATYVAAHFVFWTGFCILTFLV